VIVMEVTAVPVGVLIRMWVGKHLIMITFAQITSIRKTTIQTPVVETLPV
jgi:hypothetical protein